MTEAQMSPFMRMAWTTLEAAKDVGEAGVVAACRRAIGIYRSGKPVLADDAGLIREAYKATAAL